MCVYSRQHVYIYIYIYFYNIRLPHSLCYNIFLLSYTVSQSIIVIGVYLVQARIALRIIIVMV